VKNKVAEKIRMERLRLNLSQQNMADELNITIAAYSNLERGVTEISISRLNIIATILQQPIVYFLSEEQALDEPSSYQRSLFQVISPNRFICSSKKCNNFNRMLEE
jgi:transcriptional regulator with XRE-family HTH domain